MMRHHGEELHHTIEEGAVKGRRPKNSYTSQLKIYARNNIYAVLGVYVIGKGLLKI